MSIAKLDILDDIATTLAAITVAGGYRTTIVTVDREVKVRAEIGAAQMPYLGFGLTETISEPYLPGDLVRCVGKLTVVGHVNSSTASAATTAIANLEDDVIGALMADPTRDANAIDTVWTKTVDDVPDPASPSSNGRGSVVMEFEIRWMRSTALSPA